MGKENIKEKALHNSNQPLYQQLATLFRGYIDSGIWAVGQRIPTIEALMEDFGVGKVTIRSALDDLAKDNLIERARGQGTFVSPNIKNNKKLKIAYTWSDLVNFGYQDSLEVITQSVQEVKEIPSWCQYDGEIAESYHRLERIYFIKKERLSYSIVYIDSNIYKKINHLFRKRSIATVFHECEEIRLGRAKQILTINSADSESAASLNIPVGSPVAEVMRTIYSTDNKLLYWSKVHFPSKKVEMEFDLLNIN